MRTRFLTAVVLAAVATVPGLAAPPNVVVFLADDQGWGDLSVHGNSNLKTPHIDSLARGGALVEQFYVQPVCSPTRAEFLTGRYHPRGGVGNVTAGGERLNLDERTVAEAFKAAGYATGCFGKWHNGSQYPYHPRGRGFDEYYGFTSGHWGDYFDPPLDHNGRPVTGRGYLPDDLADHATEFIRANRERPFFCYVPFNTPHSPMQVPDRFYDRFKDAAPNCSYYTNWTTKADRITWDVEVATAGRYAVDVWYACPAADVGATVELAFGDARVTAKVAEPEA